ncbi:isopentenyl-diphosphate Delta-isomerase [Actinoplanes sp. HUAS TT8]|uniref:isopentenyl-diphosphate Delta-isomerase n=1 Tax=Actinoplanes sp. HUAS TT8 TaxID=3447453 RepID=UPI003F5263D2
MEHVVLLDEDGRSIGRRDKTSVHTDSTPLHLAFSCYVFDTAGRFLVTRRAAGKNTWPAIWTNSVCGHPAHGERLVEAVRRRAGFELGLPLDDVRLVLPRFRYRAELLGIVENEMCPVLRATTSHEPAPNPDEVDACRWVAWPAFVAEARAGTSGLSPWARLQVELLDALGPDPAGWPAADPAELPPAARW